MNIETWKPIPNFPGYEASDLGNVRSLARTAPHWRGGLKRVKGKHLNGIAHRGYLVVKLGHPNKAYGIHQCVMAAFNGWQEGKVVNHINTIKTDNRLENLEYVTNPENVHHAYKYGLMRVAGEDNGLRKIDNATAIAILSADRSIQSKDLAVQLNCSVNIVRQVRAGKTWRHVAAAVGLLLMLAGSLPAQVLLVSPQPTLAPRNCSCVDCKCDPCKCEIDKRVKLSVKKTYTPTEASVIVRNAKGKEAFQCSGTAIDDHTVLTCWHILRERDFLNLTVNDKPARLLRFDPESDVALLTTEEALKPVKVAEKPLAAGEPCHAYGYEYQNKGILYRWRTKITGLNRYRGFPNQSIAGRPQSGRSGGGLFNAAGELVGVCSAADDNEGLYAGHAAIVAILNPSTELKPQEPSSKLKDSAIKTTPFLLQDEWMQDPNCKSGQCPLIKKIAPAVKAKSDVRDAPKPVSPPQRVYYTPTRWRRR